jgi:hypothetical protein
MDNSVIEKVEPIAQKYSVPDYVWKSIMLLESGGNPTSRAYVDTEKAKKLGQGAEDSRGLFQINIFAHPDANSTRLYDPEYNAEYSFKNIIGPATKKGIEKGLSGWELTKYVEQYGQRPKWTKNVEDSLYNRYKQVTGGEAPKAMLTTSLDHAPIEPSAGIDLLKNIKVMTYASIIYFVIVVLMIFSIYKVFESEKVTKIVKEALI